VNTGGMCKGRNQAGRDGVWKQLIVFGSVIWQAQEVNTSSKPRV